MAAREPSMEEILASIKKVIAEDKEARIGEPRGLEAAQEPQEPIEAEEPEEEEEVLELNEPLAPPADLGPPLLDESAADASRSALEQLSTVAASDPAQPQTNPLEEMVREMLRPMLKQWLDEHLPQMVDDHVKREIARITGRPL
jgi:cell pole-organizing protein PopZ